VQLLSQPGIGLVTDNQVEESSLGHPSGAGSDRLERSHGAAIDGNGHLFSALDAFQQLAGVVSQCS